MPKPCPRCGLENTDEALRCKRCDAPLRDASPISPAFRQFLRALAGFAAITTIGVVALVHVHRTAVPLGDPVVPPIDPAKQEEAFAREQALEAPPPGTGPADAPLAGMLRAPPAPGSLQAPPGTGMPVPDAGTPATPDTNGAPAPDRLDPLLGEEDITDQMPGIPSTLEWNREILPPTRQPVPPAIGGSPPGFGGQAPAPGNVPAFPESSPLSSAPPINQPGGEPVPDQPPGPAADTQAADASQGQQAPDDASPASPPPAGQEVSLAAAQQAQCAKAGFLTRFACQERVRLAYCENRWNQHPDCMVESNVTNY
ncbi:MAG: hypothetical protein OZ935_04410 [Pseudomonadota bacterium]|nr:hypothetical protein [Pseudomonadota bacterium]